MGFPAWQQIGQKVFIVDNPPKRRIHRLNESASRLWGYFVRGLDSETAAQGEGIPEELAVEMFQQFRGLEKTFSLGSKPPHSVPSEQSIFEDVYQEAGKNLVPILANLEITQVCNLRCTHCYNFDRSKPIPKELKQNALNAKEIYRTIDQLRSAGTWILSFTGGEALTHPKILDFISYAREKGFWVKLKTNGFALSNENCERLREAGLHDFEISVYGGSDESHDKFTARSGSFEKTWAGIKNAVSSGLGVRLSYILHRENVSELDLMIENARRINCPFSISTELTARYDGEKSPTDLRLSRNQFKELLNGKHSDYFSAANPEGNLQCACGTSILAISSVGDLYPCIGAPVKSGNVRERSIQEIWRNSSELNRIRSLKASDFKDCEPCEDRFHCQRSSGSAFVNTGDYTGADPQACMEAQERRRFFEESSLKNSRTSETTSSFSSPP